MHTGSPRRAASLLAQCEQQAHDEHPRRLAELNQLAPLFERLEPVLPAPGRRCSMSRPRNVNPVASFLLAVVLGILAVLAMTHWMISCWGAGPQGMCTLLAAALPTRGRALSLRRRIALWWARLQMAETERMIGQYKRLLLDDSVRLQQLRDQLAQQQRAQLRRLGQP